MLHMSRSNSAEASLKIGHEGAALSRTRMPANAPESFVARFGVDRESRLAAKLCTGRLFEIEPAIQKLLTDQTVIITGRIDMAKKQGLIGLPYVQDTKTIYGPELHSTHE